MADRSPLFLRPKVGTPGFDAVQQLNPATDRLAGLVNDVDFGALAVVASDASGTVASVAFPTGNVSAILGRQAFGSGNENNPVTALSGNVLRAALGNGSQPTASTFLRGDGQWATPAGGPGGGGGNLTALDDVEGGEALEGDVLVRRVPTDGNPPEWRHEDSTQLFTPASHAAAVAPHSLHATLDPTNELVLTSQLGQGTMGTDVALNTGRMLVGGFGTTPKTWLDLQSPTTIRSATYSATTPDQARFAIYDGGAGGGMGVASVDSILRARPLSLLADAPFYQPNNGDPQEPAAGDVLTWVRGASAGQPGSWVLAQPPGSSGGEVNQASNIGQATGHVDLAREDNEAGRIPIKGLAPGFYAPGVPSVSLAGGGAGATDVTITAITKLFYDSSPSLSQDLVTNGNAVRSSGADPLVLNGTSTGGVQVTANTGGSISLITGGAGDIILDARGSGSVIIDGNPVIPVDLTTTPIAQDQGIVWNGSIFVPGDVGGGPGASTLAGLTDTSVGSATNGDVLTYNGTLWINSPASVATVSSPTTGEYLRYDGAAFVNDALDLADDTAPTLGGDLEVGAFRLVDDNGNPYLDFTETAGATGWVGITNSAGDGSTVKLAAEGSSTNLSLLIDPKGNGTVAIGSDLQIGDESVDANILSSDGDVVLALNSQAVGAVNYIEVRNGDTGVQPRIAVEGSDADISLNLAPKGTGVVKAGNVPILTTGSFLNGDVSENTFRIVQNGDTTARFELDMADVSTASTRTFTVPDADGQIPSRGSTFPANPVNGQEFFNLTDRVMYYADVTRGRWLSMHQYEWMFSQNGSVANGAFINWGGVANSQNVGPFLPFAARVVEIVAIQVAVGNPSNPITVDLDVSGGGATRSTFDVATNTRTFSDVSATRNDAITANEVHSCTVSTTGGEVFGSAGGNAIIYYLRRDGGAIT